MSQIVRKPPDQMTTSMSGLISTVFREGLKLRAYQCTAQKRRARKVGKEAAGWTIGIGSTYRYDQNGDRVPVKEGDVITVKEAWDLFVRLMREDHERGVAKAITRPLAQHEFDVLADMCFQYGRDVLLGDHVEDEDGNPVYNSDGTRARTGTGIQRAVNANAPPEEIARQFARWHWAGGRRDPGVYNRCVSRFLQWSLLPWVDVCYGGKNLMKVSGDGKKIVDVIKPLTAKTMAEGYLSLGMPLVPSMDAIKEVFETESGAAKRPAVTPGSEPSALPGVTRKKAKKRDATAPEAPPRPVEPEPKPKLKPIVSETVRPEDIPYGDMRIENGVKPMIKSERFWANLLIVLGNMFQKAAQRGTYMGLPATFVLLMVDMLKDPVVIAIMASALAGVAAIGLGGAVMTFLGLRKKDRGDESATQFTY